MMKIAQFETVQEGGITTANASEAVWKRDWHHSNYSSGTADSLVDGQLRPVLVWDRGADVARWSSKLTDRRPDHNSRSPLS